MEKTESDGLSVNAIAEGEQQSRSPSQSWQSYISEDLPRSLMESTDAAIRSARSLHNDSSAHLRSLQDFLAVSRVRFSYYEDALFKNCKDGLATALQHPSMTAGISLAAIFLLVRGPRRFLLRQTLGRFQSEEARFIRAENNLKSLNSSVDLMKKESMKLLQRATLAEKEMINGQTELMKVSKQMQHLTKSVDHVESQAAGLVDLLREIPGREALQLRAEVASVASLIKQQKNILAKRRIKLIEMGVPV
ncbi:RGS1-HXK1-interacting protein 1 [Amaranthus tricolor]|uniref:RGS1-HXK1-interacting protein 1 n=1 Tax=Amaranthus tricolor TaxID=29722 RepID=UPI002583B9CE|nr:RGS1-HXK1-interacting protein 1 [Amaranthus tricolor]